MIYNLYHFNIFIITQVGYKHTEKNVHKCWIRRYAFFYMLDRFYNWDTLHFLFVNVYLLLTHLQSSGIVAMIIISLLLLYFNSTLCCLFCLFFYHLPLRFFLVYKSTKMFILNIKKLVKRQYILYAGLSAFSCLKAPCKSREYSITSSSRQNYND